MTSMLPAIKWMSYIAAPIDRVYRTLTTAEGWDAWFTRGTSLEARPGGARERARVRRSRMRHRSLSPIQPSRECHEPSIARCRRRLRVLRALRLRRPCATGGWDLHALESGRERWGHAHREAGVQGVRL